MGSKKIVVYVLALITGGYIAASNQPIHLYASNTRNDVKSQPSQVQATPTISQTPTPTQVVTLAAEKVTAPVITQNVIVAYISRKFGSHTNTALCIAEHESGINPKAVHRNYDTHQTYDLGVFQVNVYWHPQYSWDELLDWKTNIDAAYIISNAGTSWAAWSTKHYCI